MHDIITFKVRAYRDVHTRYIDIWENVYDDEGELHHQQTISKKILLMYVWKRRIYWKYFVKHLSSVFQNEKIAVNIDDYLGKRNKRVVDDAKHAL